jgi:uncharacterized protein (DUF433 family)
MSGTPNTAQPLIGQGIYTVPEIAKILRLPYRQIRYWFDEYVKLRLQTQQDYKYYFASSKHDTVNFYSLIEAYVFYQLKVRDIKTKRALEAHDILSKRYNTPYPFAMTELLTSGADVLFRANEDKEVLIKADRSGQSKIKEVVQHFSKDIEFSGKGGLAELYYPLGKNKSVVVNPKQQFGQPVIKGTNILAETLYDLHLSGENISNIAKIYNLPLSNVKAALEYMQAA